MAINCYKNDEKLILNNINKILCPEFLLTIIENMKKI